MIGQEVSHYRILERLGGGGMGVVYKAEDTRLGRTVALKFLNAELLSNESLRRRFLHEARAASLIDHPNVCHVYEVGEAEGRTFMAMSFCEGRSLRDVIDAGKVPPREAFSIAFGIAQGLWAAHRRGIVHRDIKPGNVILTDEGFVRIVDFGLALLTGHSRVTTSGVTVGTVAYMSPEQTSGSDVGANTDIWSLGVTLYELLTARIPFRGEINAALVYSIVHEPHTPLLEANSSVPPECARIVDRCLEKDPAKRYQTVEALLEDMVSAAQTLGWESSVASATIAPILSEKRHRERMRRLAIGAAVLVLAAGIGYGGYRWTHRTPPLFVTDIRLAVMPLDNFVGSENEALVDGLGDHVARVARWVSRGHASMWTVLYATVADAQLPDANKSVSAFGVNRVLVGDVQRIGDVAHLRLKLEDAATSESLREASIPIGLDSTTASLDSLPEILSEWFGVEPSELPRGRPWRAREPRAMRPYLEGLSYQRRAAKKPDLREKALAALQKSMGADSSFVAAACAAGATEMSQFNQDGDPARLQRAVADGRRACRHDPTMTDAYILLGNAFRTLDRPDSAEACYRRASLIDSRGATVYERLGNFYASQDRMHESEEAYLRGVESNRDYWASHRWLGEFYYGQHRLDDAAAAWLRALELAPDDVVTLNNLGVYYYYRAEWPRAQEIFLRSFRIRPNCNSCNNVATALFLDGKFKEAASYFELSRSPEYCDSTDHMVLGNLASALYWVDGARSRSLALYQRAIVMAEAELGAEPDSPELVARLVDYYAMSGDSVRARDMIARADPFLAKNSDMMYRVGSAYEKLGNRALAMQHLQNAVRHGYAVPLIRSDPVLHDLVRDPRFVEMIRNEAAAEGATAAKNNQ